jgi:putative solute:sodium symporter small subunit
MHEPDPRADARHWRLSRRWAGLFGAVWFVIAFVPPFFARDLSFEFLGGPFAIWACAQGAPVVFLLLVWWHERRMDRLDREHRAGRVDR